MTARLQANISLLLGTLAACGTPSAGAPPTPTSSSVEGAVFVSPARPGPQRKGEGDRAPLAAQIVLVDRQGRVVARGESDASGRFRVEAEPGDYELQVQTGGALPRCPEQAVRIDPGRRASVQVICDSGLR
jgi:hypothetical protein